MTRAVTSVPPPGAKPTIMRIGLAGYDCACAGRQAASKMTEQSVKCERDNGELSSETALLHGGAGLIVVTSFGVARVRVK